MSLLQRTSSEMASSNQNGDLSMCAISLENKDDFCASPPFGFRAAESTGRMVCQDSSVIVLVRDTKFEGRDVVIEVYGNMTYFDHHHNHHYHHHHHHHLHHHHYHQQSSSSSSSPSSSSSSSSTSSSSSSPPSSPSSSSSSSTSSSSSSPPSSPSSSSSSSS